MSDLLNRQWVVVSTSTIVLIVVWAVTPLQNGIFSTSVINLTTAVDVRRTSGLIPLADQVVGLSGSFMMTGYGLAWLGQQPPAFTTNSYALAPFLDWQAITGSVPASPNQTITAATTLYQTSLDCATPVNISFSGGFNAFSAAFDDGKGCATDPIVPFPNTASRDKSAIWAPHYIGYWDDAALERDLALGGCPRTSNHTFLAVWAKNDNSTKTFNTASDASALFCTPSYHVQPVNATISLPDFSVLSVDPLGAKSPLSEDLFNATQFEYLLGVGVAPRTFVDAGLQRDPARFTDVSNTIIVHQDTQLRDLQIVVPTNNMIGYAVGLSDRKVERLTDPTELQRTFERAHQLLFALAVHDLMPSSGVSSTGAGVVNSTLQAVRLVPVFAIVTQALLFVILLFICYLLWSSPRRKNCLSTDPNSLAEIMSMADDAKIQKLLSQSDIATDQGLVGAISTRRFHFESNVAGSKSKLHVLDEAHSPVRPDHVVPPQQTNHPKLVRPVEYSWLLGFPFILCLAAMIVGLSIVRRKGLLENGTCDLSDLMNKANLLRSFASLFECSCPKLADQRSARTFGNSSRAILDPAESSSMYHASNGRASQRTGNSTKVSAVEVQFGSTSAQPMEGIKSPPFHARNLEYHCASGQRFDRCFQRPVLTECNFPRSRYLAKIDVAPSCVFPHGILARTICREQYFQ